MGLRSLANAAVLLAVLGQNAAADDGVRVGLSAAGGTAAFPASTHPAIIGTQLELAEWRGRFGVAAEGSLMMLTETAREGGAWLGVSMRLRVLETNTSVRIADGTRAPVDVAVQLETVLQREWWDLEQPGDERVPERTTYGLGLAAEFGGRSGPHRMFGFRADVRVLFAARPADPAVASRMAVPSTTVMPSLGRDVGVIVSIGTEFGSAR